MFKKKSLLILVFCLPLFLFACLKGFNGAEVDKLAPDFTLVDSKGKTWVLSELEGQVVFINFWATWCPPCREEMPSMQKLHTILPKDKFKMLAILNKDNPDIADTFAAKLGLTMPILNDHNNKVGRKYGLTGLPETFIVDKKGVVRKKFIGPVRWDSPGNVQMLMKYINQ